MEFKNYTLDDYIEKMKRGEFFTMGKFGDGELFCLFKSLKWMGSEQGNHNTDGHQYFYEMGISIHNTFLNEKGYYKMCNPDWFTGNKKGRSTYNLFQRYVKEFNINPPHLHNMYTSFYIDAETGKLGKLKNQLEKIQEETHLIHCYLCLPRSTRRAGETFGEST